MSQSHTAIRDSGQAGVDWSTRTERALRRAICISAVAVLGSVGVAQAFTPVPIPKPRASAIAVASPLLDPGSVAAH